MPDLHRFPRQDVAFRRRAGALVVIASLLALFLSQPFHAVAPTTAAAGGPVVSIQLPLHASAHDADFCSMCRATAQTRLGLRVALRLGEIAPDGAYLPLHLPAPTPTRRAPQLRDAQPRAPPGALPLLQT